MFWETNLNELFFPLPLSVCMSVFLSVCLPVCLSFYPSLSLLLSLFSQVLKGSKKLCMSVRSVGRIPGGYVTNHVYTWVDPHGRSVSPPPDLLEHRSATLRRGDSQRRSNMQLLQDGDEKKVCVCVCVFAPSLMAINCLCISPCLQCLFGSNVHF